MGQASQMERGWKERERRQSYRYGPPDLLSLKVSLDEFKLAILYKCNATLTNLYYVDLAVLSSNDS